MPELLATSMLNSTAILPHASKHSFWFQSSPLQLPAFDNIDNFVDNLARKSLIAYDPIVSTALSGDLSQLSVRSLQRHFLQTTGLTKRYINQIKRANQAVALLQQGCSISDVVSELGFADQAHMTRQVKVVSGCTPGEIIRKMQAACRLHSIQGYGPCAQMRVQNFKGAIYDHKALQNQHLTTTARRSAY